MLQKIFVFISGLIFGLGLTLSSMTNPAKVIGFLNIFDSWDPSLAFVMGGAILIASPCLFILEKRKKLILKSETHLPDKSNIDRFLIIGSIIFGIGWGAVGFCPGPAISSIAFLNPLALIFVCSMIAGFYISQIIKQT